MKSRIQFILIIALIATISILTSCTSSNEQETKQILPVNIKIQTVTKTLLTDAIHIAGTVKAYEDINISPEEGGVVKEWIVKKGQHVKKGELIGTLKDEVIKAGLDAADAQYNIAEMNLRSQKGVYEEKGISEVQYKSMVYNRDAAKANADLLRARWEHTQIKSPIDGILENTIPYAGEFAPPGVPIARVVNTSTVKVQAEVPERYARVLSLGTNTVITFDALPGDTLRGAISYVGATVSPVNRTIIIEIVISNPFKKLKPEMVANVMIMLETKNDAIVVSEDIIQLVDRDRYIIYIEKDGKAEERQILLGGRENNMVEVTQGLHEGDHLIIAGFHKLVNGSPVAISE